MNDKTIKLPDEDENFPNHISVQDLNNIISEPIIDPAIEVSPELINIIKSQILTEMKNDDVRKYEEDKIRRKQEKEEHDAYVQSMKQSPDPWVEIVGWTDTKNGVKIELDWNDVFINELRKSGISGSDEDQIIQKWLISIMHDLSSKINKEESPYE